MKRLLFFFRRLFYVEYRLAAFYDDSPAPRNTYARRLAVLVRMAKAMPVSYWVIFKRGPFFRKERSVRQGGYML